MVCHENVFLDYPTIFATKKVYINRYSSSTQNYDVIIISGDAYVDHHAFPTAVIARLFQYYGLNVAIIAQPDWCNDEEFKVFGKPNLCFAVTAGSMDSMVANYTSQKYPRSIDRLSPGGKTGFRPKRAIKVYTQKLRSLYPDTPIIIGGIEASLRRFVHYDFWEDKINPPILIDAPADLLVYGMAEGVVKYVIDWLVKASGNRKKLIPTMLPQCCVKTNKNNYSLYLDIVKNLKHISLPSYSELASNKQKLIETYVLLENSNKPDAPIIIQPHPKGSVICFPPIEESYFQEIKVFNALRFLRNQHPIYEEEIPALKPVQFSVVSHRGCLGRCTFCALALHQGRRIRSRNISSIVYEVRECVVNHSQFRGTVPDVGGPSINMFGWDVKPNTIHNLVELLRNIRNIDQVNFVFLGSGLRYDLIKDDKSELEALEELLKFHISGQLKVAPEHVDKDVLRLMRKAPNANFEKFIDTFNNICKKIGVELYIIPYFMTCFPGSVGKDWKIAEFVKKHKLAHKQIQEFTPTPGTLASIMYFTELDYNLCKISVAKKLSERAESRKIIQVKIPSKI